MTYLKTQLLLAYIPQSGSSVNIGQFENAMRDICKMRCIYSQAFYETDRCLFGSGATRQLLIDIVNGITIHRMVFDVHILVSENVNWVI